MKRKAPPEAENPMYGKFDDVVKSLVLPREGDEDASVAKGHPDTKDTPTQEKG